MGLKTGVFCLVTLFGAGSFGDCCDAHTSKKSSRTVVEYHLDEAEANLQCDDGIAKVSTNGSVFYACDEDVNPEFLRKLEYFAAVKEYGQENLGLRETENYQVYKNRETDVPVTVYRLYVIEKDKMPQKWENYKRIAKDGEHKLEIKGMAILHSQNDNLLDEKKYYSEQGYDTYWRSITSFAIPNSGCNLTPEFLEQSAAEQASDILHEDFHLTTDKESGIEESFATLIGRVGAVEITKTVFGEDSEEHKEAKRNLERRLNFSKEVIETNSRLLELYEKDIPLEEKLAEKEKIMDESGHTNNAEIWDRLPYTKNFPLIYEVYQKYPDLPGLIKLFLNCPENEEEGIEYLKEFLGDT